MSQSVKLVLIVPEDLILEVKEHIEEMWEGEIKVESEEKISLEPPEDYTLK